MKIQDIYQLYKKSYKVSTDTRNLINGCIFFALKGETFNANKFAEKALTEGASYVVIDEKAYYKEDKRYILVENVLETLQALAKYHRVELGIPIIALTGSNGKTTTKELINVVLANKYRTTATQGNLNNHIGVPLTLLSMTPQTDIGIVEMGANHFGEIAQLCEIAMPDYGYITNFGKAHLEGFGSLEGVINAKTELYKHLKKYNKLVFVNHFDTIQIEKSKDQNRQLIGEHVKNIQTKDFVKVQLNSLVIETNLLGSYNYFNIIVAIGIGQFFKVPDAAIKSALETYVPTNKRSQLIILEHSEIILDAYNANPTSMRAALSSFKDSIASKKVLILGDMFELGESSELEHQQIVNYALSIGVDTIVLIGHNFFKTKESIAKKFKEFVDFEVSFDNNDYKGATILIKGSRGMALERVVELFEKY